MIYFSPANDFILLFIKSSNVYARAETLVIIVAIIKYAEYF